eukprot:SAG11_NODE_3654_length_2307_cov_4.945199_2_plen_265_part_00
MQNGDAREVSPLQVSPLQVIPKQRTHGEEGSNTRAGVRNFMNSAGWDGIIAVATIWSLFSGDVTFAFLNKSADPVVATISIVFCVIFTIEIILNFWCHRDYGALQGFGRLTVFFWVDLVGTASLVPEILDLFGAHLGSPKAAALARAGRAARIGARLTRLVRFCRDKRLRDAAIGRQALIDADGIIRASPTALMSDQISKRVVILVLGIIICVPPLTYFECAAEYSWCILPHMIIQLSLIFFCRPPSQDVFGLDAIEVIFAPYK